MWARELDQEVRIAEFHRGFIDTITMRARAFVQEGERLFQATPVHWLRFNYLQGIGERLAATPALGHIRSLNLASLKIPHDDLAALISSPLLAQLQELNLSYGDIPRGAEIGRILRRAHFVPSLRTLSIINLEFAKGFLKAMANGAHYPKLRELALPAGRRELSPEALAGLDVPCLDSLAVRGSMTVEGVRGICQLPVAQLKQLDLAQTGIPAKGLQLLAEQGALDNIEELDLNNCNLGVRAIEAVFRGEQLSHCRHLRLQGIHNLALDGKMPHVINCLASHSPLQSLQQLELDHLRDPQLQTLAQSAHLQNLRALYVRNLQVDTPGAEAVVGSGWPDSLRHMVFRAATISREAVRVLCSRTFPNLLKLDLDSPWDTGDGSIEESAIIDLIESQAFPSLRSLSLSHLPLSSMTLDALANRSNFPELRKLNFEGNRIDDQSVRSVLTSTRLPKLQHLSALHARGLRNRPKLSLEFGARIGV